MRGLVLVAVVLLLVLAACGDGGEEGSPTPSPAATATPRPTGAEEPVRYSRGVYTIDSDGSGLTLLARLPFWPMRTRSHSLSLSGRFLAFVDGKYPTETVYLIGVGGEEEPRALATFQSVWDLALSPEGDQIMVHGRLNDAKGLYLVATQDGTVAPFPTPMDSASELSWSPTGDQLAFFGMPETDSSWSVYIADSDGGGLRSLASGYGSLAWSPDGSRIAYTLSRGADAGVLLLDGEGNVTRLSDTRPDRGTRPAWAPDGSRIAFVEAAETEEASRIRIVDVESGDEVALTRGTDPAWAPDGSRLAVIRDGDLYLINADGSQETRLTSASQPYVAEPSWLPDGLRLVFSFMPPVMGSIYLINPDGSEEIWLADGYGPEWSPDGEMIAFVGGGMGGGLGGRSDIYVINSAGTEVRKVGAYNWSDVGPECFGWAKYAWSPDSRFIVYHSMVDRRIFLARADGKEQAVEIAEGGDADWSPEGGRIAFSSVRRPCKVYLTHIEGERETEELTVGESPAWSPDGRLIAFSREGALYVINADGTGERELPASVGVMQQPVWSPDGSRIATVSAGVVAVVNVEDGEVTDIGRGRDPTWSSDGTQIAFVVDRGPGQGPDSIYIVDADGSGEPQWVTKGEYPAWSPDGQRIAFVR